MITAHQRDAVLYVDMSSPPVNAFSVEFLEELLGIFHSAARGTGAVVLGSAVSGIFAAGGDLPYMAAATATESEAYVRLCQRTYSALENPEIVSIAVIDGACLAGGLEIALACDIRVASPASRVGLPEVTHGILAGGGAIHRLVRAVGQGVARDMLLTGEPLEGPRAHAVGLVTRLSDDPMAEASRIAERVSAFSPQAIEKTKELALAASTEDLDEGMRRELLEWLAVRSSPNAQEGLQAFVDRRPPSFQRVS